jgi:hypothetical protein
LTIEEPGAGLPRLPRGLTDIAAQEVMEKLPGALVLPPSTRLGDQLPGGHVMGQPAPGPATAQDLEDALEHVPLGVLLRPPSDLGLGDIRGHHRPFVLGEIARVRLSGVHAPNCTP